MFLSIDNLVGVFRSCLADPADLKSSLIVEGVYLLYAYDPAKLREHREDIRLLLDQLPAVFSMGSGYSMEHAIRRKDGSHWTHLHHHAEILLSLGVAIGKVETFRPGHSLSWSLPHRSYFRIVA